MCEGVCVWVCVYVYVRACVIAIDAWNAFFGLQTVELASFHSLSKGMIGEVCHALAMRRGSSQSRAILVGGGEGAARLRFGGPISRCCGCGGTVWASRRVHGAGELLLWGLRADFEARFH